MTTARIPYLMGGVLVAGFAALSILSYNSLRTDVNRTSEIVFWSVIKDSTDKNVLQAYLTKYPDGMFVPAVKARMDDLEKGGGTMIAAAPGTIAAQIAALQAQQQAAEQAQQKAAEDAKAKAEAEATRIVAEAKAAAARQSELAKAEIAKANEEAKAVQARVEQARQEAAKQAEMAKAEAARVAEQAKVEQARIEQAKVEAAKQAEATKAEAAKQAELAKAEAAKQAEQAKAAAAKQIELDKAEAAKQAEIVKAEAAKAAEQARIAAARPAPVPVPVPVPVPSQQQAARPAAAPAPQAATPKAAAPLPAPAPGTASFVIISSTADSIKKGDRVTSGQSIAVPSGTRVVLMDGTGKVMTVRGPFTGTLGASEPTAPTPRPTGAFRSLSEAIDRLGNALIAQAETQPRIGAFRGVGASGLGLGTTQTDPWTIDVSAAGHWCVQADKAVSLARGQQAEFDSITIETKPSGAKMSVPWPKTQATLQWPASVPVKNGTTYDLRLGATTTSIAIHMLDQKGLSSGQIALWMADQGCQRQASAMIDSLERGLAGKLFDLDVVGDGRSSADYKVGEKLNLSVRTTREAYVYCFYRDVAGEVTKIFPSQFDNSAQIGTAPQAIPADSWTEPMLLTGPAGASEVQCFAVDRDATKHLPKEIANPGFTVLPAKMASSLIDLFKKVPDGNLATASLPITVTE